MNHDWYGGAKSFRQKQSQHDDLKCGEAHPRKPHVQWGRELTELWETHRVKWQRIRPRSIAGDPVPVDGFTYCEVVHPKSSHVEWSGGRKVGQSVTPRPDQGINQNYWTNPRTGVRFYSSGKRPIAFISPRQKREAVSGDWVSRAPQTGNRGSSGESSTNQPLSLGKGPIKFLQTHRLAIIVWVVIFLSFLLLYYSSTIPETPWDGPDPDDLNPGDIGGGDPWLPRFP
jgi:hypothetical protein